MSRTKNNLMNNIEHGLVKYNPRMGEYVSSISDSELAEQSILQSAERLKQLVDNHKRFTFGKQKTNLRK